MPPKMTTMRDEADPEVQLAEQRDMVLRPNIFGNQK